MTYYAEIERYFLKKRGSGLILSPKDWQIMNEWEEQGIPLRVILRGIDNTFNNKTEIKEEINFLAYCKTQVNKSWRFFKQQYVGSTTIEDNSPNNDNQFIKEHILKLKKTLKNNLIKGDPLFFIWQKTYNLLGELENKKTSLAEAELTLLAIRRATLKEVKANLPQTELAELKSKVERTLKGYRRQMLPEAYKITCEELLDDMISQEYNVPQFEMYQL